MALTIGKTKQSTAIAIIPNIPIPRSKIIGMQIRIYRNMLIWKLIIDFPFSSIFMTVSLCVSHRTKGTINPPNPVTISSN
tara:strand:- start:378 stop:617 length:240 start_codon:yes stop_codon:yes gene_type:complete